MKKVLIALSICVASVSFATEKPKNECGNNGNNCNPGSGAASAQAGAIGVGIAGAAAISRNANRNTNVNTNVAAGGRASARAEGGNAVQGQLQGQQQGQSLTSSQELTATQGNAQSTTINQTTTAPSDVTLRNTGDAMGYAAPPSAVCAMTGGAGVAVPGFGGSVSGSSIDKGCEAREFARVLVNLGQAEAGVRVLCEANESVARNVKACADIDAANKARAASNKANDTRPTTDSMN